MLSTVSGLRMGLFVYIEQIFWIHVRVALGRREARVAEQLLNGPQVPSSLQKVRGEGVAQSVSTRLRSN